MGPKRHHQKCIDTKYIRVFLSHEILSEVTSLSPCHDWKEMNKDKQKQFPARSHMFIVSKWNKPNLFPVCLDSVQENHKKTP